ncbi:hypothetical protein L211DRAFT_223315 [Terfezia boudieri ATCC MYA-4762]|uniref:Uncharacterized protein n=1 Tax=Terfezia boudieri ATCC MYA-4762 TaxID=1051890 RepID=A0A3N4M0G1_9PEZI|nr:hypothetical protein L211DRAFT_223315 [Terfezia boudieri ATCC MYA-4762]
MMAHTYVFQKDPPDNNKDPMPSKTPLPLSATQEAQVRDVYYARVRGLCAEEIRGLIPSQSLGWNGALGVRLVPSCLHSALQNSLINRTSRSGTICSGTPCRCSLTYLSINSQANSSANVSSFIPNHCALFVI